MTEELEILLRNFVTRWRSDWETCARGNEWYNTKADAADELESFLDEYDKA